MAGRRPHNIRHMSASCTFSESVSSDNGSEETLFPCHHCLGQFTDDKLACCTARKTTRRHCNHMYCRGCLRKEYGTDLSELIDSTDILTWKCPACRGRGECKCARCRRDFSGYGGRGKRRTAKKPEPAPRLRRGSNTNWSSTTGSNSHRRSDSTSSDEELERLDEENLKKAIALSRLEKRGQKPPDRQFMLLLGESKAAQDAAEKAVQSLGGGLTTVWGENVVVILASRRVSQSMKDLLECLQVNDQPFSEDVCRALYNALSGPTISLAAIERCVNKLEKTGAISVDQLLNEAIAEPGLHDNVQNEICEALLGQFVESDDSENGPLVEVDDESPKLKKSGGIENHDATSTLGLSSPQRTGGTKRSANGVQVKVKSAMQSQQRTVGTKKTAKRVRMKYSNMTASASSRPVMSDAKSKKLRTRKDSSFKRYLDRLKPSDGFNAEAPLFRKSDEDSDGEEACYECHHCLSDFVGGDLAFCTKAISRVRRCTNAYCRTCLKQYDVDLNQLVESDWACLACRKVCACSLCRPDFNTYGGVAGNGGPVRKQTSAPSLPPKVRKREKIGVTRKPSAAPRQSVMLSRKLHPNSIRQEVISLIPKQAPESKPGGAASNKATKKRARQFSIAGTSDTFSRRRRKRRHERSSGTHPNLRIFLILQPVTDQCQHDALRAVGKVGGRVTTKWDDGVISVIATRNPEEWMKSMTARISEPKVSDELDLKQLYVSLSRSTITLDRLERITTAIETLVDCRRSDGDDGSDGVERRRTPSVRWNELEKGDIDILDKAVHRKSRFDEQRLILCRTLAAHLRSQASDEVSERGGESVEVSPRKQNSSLLHVKPRPQPYRLYGRGAGRGRK